MSYRVTYPYIEMDVIDVNAKNNIQSISTKNKSFANINLFKEENKNVTDNYMSLEQNYSILDGDLYELPSDTSNIKLAYYSSQISDENCMFDADDLPTITITFSDFVTSAGLTLEFGGNNLPSYMKLKLFDENNNVIFYDDYFPDEFKFYCGTLDQVYTYKKVELTFLKTKYPYNSIKINDIDFGIEYYFKKQDLINADIFEETDILSINLTTDTLNFTITSEDDDFNILNRTGIYYALQKNQNVRVYEIIETYEDGTTNLIDSKTVFLGNYYSREWQSSSKKEITFKCIDLIGILEDTKFDDGIFYTPDLYTVKDVIDKIMKVANITNYTISDDIKNKGVYGILPSMSCRQALHQIIFFIGAVASCSRSNNINIYLPSHSIKNTISDDNHFDDDVIKLNQYVSQINVYEYDLETNSGESEIFKGYLDVGTHKIVTNNLICVDSNNPYISRDGTTGIGTISETIFGLHYFIINVTSSGNFVVKSKTYSLKPYNIISVKNNEEKNVIGKTISIDKNYFLSRNRNANIDYATPTIERMLDYYNKRNECNCSFLLNDEVTGDWIYIKNQYGDITKANILNMKIDLSGGFIATAKLVCYENLEDKNYRYYSSTLPTEIFSGETVGII